MAGYDSKKKLQDPWWALEAEEDISRALFDLLTSLEDDQRQRRDKNMQCLRLYGNADFIGMGPYQYAKTNSANLPENRVKMNIVSSMIDTVSAKVSKMRPRVRFLTQGGDFFLREKAKKLDKFVGGLFQKNSIYLKHQQMFKDSCIFDIGALKHYREGGEICTERVLSTEIYVDTADAMYGDPSHLYHVKYVRKDVLAAQFPEHRAAIYESAGCIDKSAVTYNLEGVDEYVVVIEGWKRPTGSKKKDGKHIIAVEKAVLETSRWKHDWFPFTFDFWSRAIIGFYGQSLADRLTGNQIEINKMLRIIQRSFHLGSAFKVFLEYGSKVAREHINNEIGSLVYYNGTPPTFYTPQTVHPEFFRHLEWLVRSSYEEAGISQLSAASKMPAGIDGGSGKALREYQDLETERFVLTAQEYETSFLRTAEIYIELAREAYAKGEDIEAVGESKRFLESIKWSEIEVEDNDFIMQMFPVSSLPQEPAGRLAYVQELIGAGFVSPEFGLSLLEFPDTDAWAKIKTAPLDDLLETFDLMLYRGKYTPPEPFQNLKLGLELGQSIYLRAKIDEAPEDRLELIRRWMATAQEMISATTQAVEMQQGLTPSANTASNGGVSPDMQGAATPITASAAPAA